jgi:hypothetical protein
MMTYCCEIGTVITGHPPSVGLRAPPSPPIAILSGLRAPLHMFRYGFGYCSRCCMGSCQAACQVLQLKQIGHKYTTFHVDVVTSDGMTYRFSFSTMFRSQKLSGYVAQIPIR